jgi:hypothetical protein
VSDQVFLEIGYAARLLAGLLGGLGTVRVRGHAEDVTEPG